MVPRPLLVHSQGQGAHYSLNRDLSPRNVFSLSLALLSGIINAKYVCLGPEVPREHGFQPTSPDKAPVSRPHFIRDPWADMSSLGWPSGAAVPSTELGWLVHPALGLLATGLLSHSLQLAL